MLRLLLFVLPLGLDTLGVSVSLGIKGARAGTFGKEGKRNWVPPWLGSALLFSLAETVMPLVGLLLGYASSVVISYVMQVVGPLLLIAVGLWELQGEIRERLDKSKGRQNSTEANPAKPSTDPKRDRHWGRQLLLALSVSLDELAVGFSLGAITAASNALRLCVLIGLQGFLMTCIGLTLGRMLRTRLGFVKEWTEFLSCFLLIALGIWLLVT